MPRQSMKEVYKRDMRENQTAGWKEAEWVGEMPLLNAHPDSPGIKLDCPPGQLQSLIQPLGKEEAWLEFQ